MSDLEDTIEGQTKIINLNESDEFETMFDFDDTIECQNYSTNINRNIDFGTTMSDLEDTVECQNNRTNLCDSDDFDITMSDLEDTVECQSNRKNLIESDDSDTFDLDDTIKCQENGTNLNKSDHFDAKICNLEDTAEGRTNSSHFHNDEKRCTSLQESTSRRVTLNTRDVDEKSTNRSSTEKSSNDTSNNSEVTKELIEDAKKKLQNIIKYHEVYVQPRLKLRNKPVFKHIERQIMVHYLMANNAIRASRGYDIWAKMIADDVLPYRTFQSLQNQFRKVILPNIEDFNIPQPFLIQFLSLKNN